MLRLTEARGSGAAGWSREGKGRASAPPRPILTQSSSPPHIHQNRPAHAPSTRKDKPTCVLVNSRHGAGPRAISTFQAKEKIDFLDQPASGALGPDVV
jgi:hypothetical protein